MKKQNIDRPYEKFMAFGPAYLTDAELLAIIIRTGTKGEDALELAKRILSLGGNRDGLLGLHHLTLNQLLSVHGIGEVKAVRLKCIAELSSRIAETRALQRIQFERPQLVAEYYMEQMRHLEYEKIICIMLDNKVRMISEQTISTGTVNKSILSARDIFMKALEQHAVYIMLLHNHPSGDPTPSGEDVTATKQIRAAGNMLQIPLLDHIVIGDGRYISMVEQGML
ncbi:MAG: DNA repair protein RadC [Lachnospiraceae bacterium]